MVSFAAFNLACRSTMRFAILVVLLSQTASGEKYSDHPVSPDSEKPSCDVAWLTDYRQARLQAIESGKSLLVHFMGSSADERHDRFTADTCTSQEVQHLLGNYVCLRVPSDLSLRVEGRRIVLLEDPAFDAMQETSGLAVVDFGDPMKETFGRVIGALPFTKPTYYAPPFQSRSSVVTFLKLPPGSLAERMIIYAIRMHPEGPRSTVGGASPTLSQAAAKHSQRQALLQRQGHHRWESRFHRIWEQIGGKPPVEVCAESWPDEPLVTACLGCVHAWRQSAGHWKSVAGDHPLYAYGMHRGKNRIWYATGIFGG